MRSTKIVATIGPACRDLDTLERMIRAGMDVARLNFAHESPEEHAVTVQMLREAAERAGSEDDLRLIDAGVEMGVDLLALSFVRRREDLEPVHERLRAHGRDIPVLAKIEKPQAAANAEEIIRAAQGIMVARGDLGIE